MIEIIPNWHPILVHFTVALLVLTGLGQLALWLFNGSASRVLTTTVQQWLVAITMLAILATLATGWYAYNTVAHDTPSHLAMSNHRNWALITAGVFLFGAICYFFFPRLRHWLAGGCFVAASLLVSVTAFKGGELVYRYGLGVMSIPAAHGEGHQHDHRDELGQNQEHDHDHDDVSSEHSHNRDASDTESETADRLNSEVKQAVMQFHAALNNGDADLAKSLLDDSVIIFEGGGVERSADEYAGHHLLEDIQFMKNMQVKTLEQQVLTFRDSAISLTRSQISGLYHGKAIDMQSMETMALSRQNGAWKIVHIHWSN